MSLPSSMADFVPCDRLLQKDLLKARKKSRLQVAIGFGLPLVFIFIAWFQDVDGFNVYLA